MLLAMVVMVVEIAPDRASKNGRIYYDRVIDVGATWIENRMEMRSNVCVITHLSIFCLDKYNLPES